MQHAKQQFYREWKEWIVKQAFARHDIDTKLDSYFSAPLGSRRRAVFSARRVDGELQLGFAKRESNDLINLKHSPVLTEKNWKRP